MEYKRKPKRVTATTIDKIVEKKIPYIGDNGEVSGERIECWLILGNGKKIRCHRDKECNCPNIGDYAVTFVKGDKPFHMTKVVFEDAFMKTNSFDKICSFFERLVKRG